MATLSVHAHAKLNLGLRVVGRRPDGYHLLQSTMVALDLADTLLFTVKGTRSVVHCEPECSILPKDNLVLRALQAILSRARADVGIEVTLRKRIPLGAGLGGGSSDAAAALVGANCLLRLGLTDDELHALATKLGADVPFFLGPSPAWMEGIGDRLRPTPVQLPAVFLLLLPPRGCSTPEVYRLYDAQGHPWSAPSSPQATPTFDNDLYPAAATLYPELNGYRQLLAQDPHTTGIGLSGSGSCLFAAYPDRSLAETAKARLNGRTDANLLVAAPTPRGYNILK